MSCDTFAQHDHKWIIFSILHSFVCLVARLFVCLFIHSFIYSTWYCCCANDSFGRLPRCHFHTYRIPYVFIIYFIILRDFMYFCISFSLSDIFCFFKKQISAASVHFDKLKLHVWHTLISPFVTALFPEMNLNNVFFMQLNINVKQNFNGLLSYHLFTFK